MRSVWVICVCLLTACSTDPVRCERHLTAINVPQRPTADALAPDRAKEASARNPGAAESRGTSRVNAEHRSGEPKVVKPVAVGKGAP